MISFLLIHFFLSSVSASVATPVAIPERAPVTLDQAYRATLNLNEDVANQAELVQQAELQYSQAKGALFPTVNANASYLRQQTPPTGTATNISPSEQETVKLTATQPLFRGFREWAALKEEKLNTEAAKLKRDEVLRQMYFDLAQSYYQVQMAEKDYQNLQVEIAVNEQRLTELKNFERIGRSRASEVLTEQANIASLNAQLASAKYTIENSRAAFSLLTGLSRKSTLKDDTDFPSSIAHLHEYLAKIERRPDVLAAQKTVDMAEQSVKVAKGGHLPSLDLSGNYYFLRPDGYLKNVKWDVQLALTFPIFEGGIVNAQVETAASQLKQAELGLAKTRRIAQQQIETLFAQVKNDLSQIGKQKTAVDLNQKNYDAEQKDYRNGLVTNIEVLTSLTNAQEARRDLDKAQYQFQINYIQLLTATAERPVVDPSSKE